MATLRCFLATLILTILPLSSTQILPDKSLLLFGMLSMDRNVSSCTYLAAKIEYTGGFASFMDQGGMDSSTGVSGAHGMYDVAGTVVCPERASASGSTSYLITIPMSAGAIEASSHGFVKLYGVQAVDHDGDIVFKERVTGSGVAAPKSLAVKQHVLVSTSEKKVNVDVDMTGDGTPVDLGSRSFSSSMDGNECLDMMRRAFGHTPEAILWASGRDVEACGNQSVAAKGCGGARENERVCCGRRPTIACAGIGLGAVLFFWLAFSRWPRGRDVEERSRSPGKGLGKKVKETESPDNIGTPDKRLGVPQTDVREWKREGDRLRRDIKRQSADLQTSSRVQRKS